MMITSNETVSVDNKLKLAPTKPLGLYLHIPFCVQKCSYCDFLSFGGTGEEAHNEYIRALCREIEYYGTVYRNIYYVESIFIGGGTPSSLKANLIAELADSIKKSFLIVDNAEFTIESNPKTLSEKKLKTYLESGINRLSMGAQSMDDNLLSFLGRIHSQEDLFANYQLARKSGFENINLDLMFAVPGQTLEIWMNTLEQVIRLAPEHISFYSLQLEEGTPFYSMYQAGTLKETDSELDRRMYHEALDLLKKKDYLHYEISNAAKAGHQSRHNLKYWSMADYLGLGLGAHSYIGGTRFSNVENLSDYSVSAIEKFKAEEQREKDIKTGPFTVWKHENSKQEDISEYLFTSLRKTEGIDLRSFEERFGERIEYYFMENWNKIQRFIDEGYLVKKENKMFFSIKGIDISNRILSEFV